MIINILKKRFAEGDFPSGKALLAVSGGVDSMLLWAIYQQLGIPYAVAHFNFQLRGEESEADQALIETAAKDLGTEIHLRKAKADAYAAEHKLSIQEAAREMRYQWLNELMAAGKADHLVTAHHLDDQLETFLINLNRSSGIKGLNGIKSSDKLFRPLLDFSKAELLEAADQLAVNYREDASNRKDDYLRNWFRNQLIPLWKEKNPDLLQRMKTTFAHLKETEAIQEHFLQKELEGLLSATEKGPQSIMLSELKSTAFQEAVLFYWLEAFGFNRSQIGDIWRAIGEQKVGAIFETDGSQLLLDRDHLILKVKTIEKPDPLKISKSGEFIFGKWQLSIDLIKAEEVVLSASQTEFFDAGDLDFPFQIRSWKVSDRMHPLGMSGSKKISDIFIDQKVDRFEKESWPLVVSNQDIASLLGLKISERFKVKDSSEKILRIRWKKD